MTKLHDLHAQGQSIWLDYIRRSFLEDGGMQAAIDQGVRGVTSNPSIFEQAIAGSNDYDTAFGELVLAGKSTQEIYDALVIADIQHAADLLRPIYDASDGIDGVVSLEVSPTLAHDTDGTIEEARRYHAAVDRPNVMIKVPATPEGIPAIETLTADGININVTLIFSVEQYVKVANAYIAGLQKRLDAGQNISKIASVASFFVSRVDVAVDKLLTEKGEADLLGNIAIANSKLAYERFKAIFSGEAWDALAAQGARVQRPLWASTGTKNPNYSDVLYVDTLIGPHTVNTLPPDTLDAVIDDGTVARTIDTDVHIAQEQFAKLAALGINIDAVTDQLLKEGVEKFAQAFESLMTSLEAKQERVRGLFDYIQADLGDAQAAVDAACGKIHAGKVIKRIWNHDHTVWADSEDEITNRLGWLHSPNVMRGQVKRINAFVEAVKGDGYTHALLLGMGGSSLAPEVFRETFGVADGYLDLAVLDSTDPGYVLGYDDALDLSKTLFIVATKSGGTAETLSFFKYFYNRVVDTVGKDAAGKHFVAITDPGSKLETMADQYQFRATFLNDPNIGGRYSVLSFFGILPAALVGVDVERILQRASDMVINCSALSNMSESDNNGGLLGVIVGEMAQAGRDKLTLVTSPAIAHFGDWVEQLVAESTGKNGKGILPVVGEPLGTPDVYGDDRLFVYLQLANDTTHNAALDALKAAGHPLVTITLRDIYDLGAQYFLWEMATVVAGHIMGIQPFDQPNVESAKKSARAMIAEYEKTGKLPTLDAALSGDGITVYGDVQADNPAAALKAFLDQAQAGDYVALQAFTHPNAASDDALKALQSTIRDTYKLAVTVGYGPRFLHSTGQLHKGDAGNGLFVQFLATMPRDADIPDTAGEDASAMSFGTLKEAQALGDRTALLDENRRVLRFHLGDDVAAALTTLQAGL